MGNHVVRVDPKKFSSMQEWFFPKTFKNLHGFWGLIGYYRKFVKKYDKIVVPLKSLLNKNSFWWNEEAKQEFYTLKKAVYNTPILVVPIFSKTFLLECDVSGTKGYH